MLKAFEEFATELKEEVFVLLDTSEIWVDFTRFVVDAGMLDWLDNPRTSPCKSLLFFSVELLFS